MKEANYREIVMHYETCLERYGDNHLGVDWPNKDDALKRYQVMLDVIQYLSSNKEVSLLDFGCGTAGLLEFIKSKSIGGIVYSGLDISPKFTDVALKKFPTTTFYTTDLMQNPDSIPQFDFILMNGVFTEKRGLSYDQMLDYFMRLIKIVYAKAEMGIAFNVMSKHVDWERDDLFHLPFDTLASFLRNQISRNFLIRNDYGLYEYSVYVFRHATL